MNTTTTDERWKSHPNLLPALHGIRSGTLVRLRVDRGSARAGDLATIYAIDSNRHGPSFRYVETDDHTSMRIDDTFEMHNGWDDTEGRAFEVISTPDGTTPPPTFTWVNEDLKNLVHQHPRAEITRGLIRKLYDAVVPAELTTGEEIEAWALEKGLTKAVARPAPSPSRRTTTAERTITITATITGTERGVVVVTRDFTSEVDVEVPFSVFEEGSRAVRQYVHDEANERMWDNADYGDDEVDWSTLEYDDSDSDSPDFDMDDAVEEYEEATAEEEEDEEDED